MLEGLLMRKYGVEVTKGNVETVIKTFEDKDAAMEFGAKYFAKLPKGEGIVTCFEADFDEHNHKIGSAERIHHVWY